MNAHFHWGIAICTSTMALAEAEGSLGSSETEIEVEINIGEMNPLMLEYLAVSMTTASSRGMPWNLIKSAHADQTRL